MSAPAPGLARAGISARRAAAKGLPAVAPLEDEDEILLTAPLLGDEVRQTSRRHYHTYMYRGPTQIGFSSENWKTTIM